MRFDKLKPLNQGKREYWRYVPSQPPINETGRKADEAEASGEDRWNTQRSESRSPNVGGRCSEVFRHLQAVLVPQPETTVHRPPLHFAAAALRADCSSAAIAHSAPAKAKHS